MKSSEKIKRKSQHKETESESETNMTSSKKPLVTVGVCVRNSEPFIENAIKSIILQDFPYDLTEVIFVDDGSTDGTLSIIKNYVSKMDTSTKVFHSEWSGLGAARNTVVTNANGDYIIWVDGDMILAKDFVRRQLEFMERNRNVGIAAGTTRTPSWENLVLTLELIPLIVDRLQRDVWKTDDATKLPGTGGAIYRIEAIRQVGGFDEKIQGAGEDQLAAKKIKDFGWLICRSNAVYFETHGNMSTWRDLWRKYLWYGSSCFDIYHQKKSHFVLYKMVPGFLSGLLISVKAYKVLGKKIVFLIPFQFAFKMFAWSIGFLKSQISAYLHS